MTQALTLERRDDQVGVLRFDVPNEDVNLLRPELLEQFHTLLDDIERDGQLEGVVIASGKEDHFSAGADVNLLAEMDSREEITALAHDVHKLMDRLENLSLPVVAAIHGTCVGGGLELALACDARLASEADATHLGLPEVKLGLIPGAGGTQRLPEVIGIEEALNLILTGETISPKEAVALGLIEEAVPRWILLDVAAERARERPSSERSGPGSSDGFDMDRVRALLLEDNPVGRRVLFHQAEKRVLARTHGNLPAPLRAIDVVRTGIEAGYDAEATAFGDLATSSQARELIYLFQARQELKGETWVEGSTLEGSSRGPRTPRKVGMLGAGLMGSGIAYVTAVEAGLPVRMKDIDHEKLRGGLRSIQKLLTHQVEEGALTEWERNVTMTRIHPTTDYSGFGRADLVIEAVIEDLDVKQQVLGEVQKHAPDDVILASNTSSIPIAKLAEVANHPERVIGMHYFSPVPKLPLLEVIVTDQTAPDVIRRAVHLGKQQGKTVIVVNDGPGFYTTRILAPYMSEAVRLVMEGVPIEDVDQALVAYGFPMGPLRLLDEVGIDTAREIMAIMEDAFGERMSAPPGIELLADDERYGEKNGRGFYQYDGNGGEDVDESVYQVLGVKPERSLDTSTIQERCALRMVNEAATCYGEGILRSARDGNVGAVFGLGYPPFLGGPFRTIDSQGAGEVVETLEHYQSEHGARFAPAPLLKTMAQGGLSFAAGTAPEPGGSVREGGSS